MSYCNKIYKIKPKTSYKISRNCANCGGKSEYINTNRFRVNANGNKIDVWLIYQCEKCRHTCNLTIYERVNPKLIKEEYEKFLINDIELSLQYGTNRSFFKDNKAEICMESLEYEIEEVHTNEEKAMEAQIVIENPYELKLRTDKVLAEILKVSRNQMKQLIEEGEIQIKEKSKKLTFVNAPSKGI